MAVFDLDGTLVRGDSFARFTRQLLFRQRWRTTMSLLAAPLLGPMLFLPPTRRAAITGFLWLASLGLSGDQFRALARQFAATHADRRIPVALDRLQQHLAAGHQVIIVTACADPLATAICTELGLPGIEVIAARLRPSRTGMRPDIGCQGNEKVQRLRAAGVTLPIDYAYTDSSADLPLLRAATHRFLIEASARHVTRIQAAFPDGVTLLDAASAPRLEADESATARTPLS